MTIGRTKPWLTAVLAVLLALVATTSRATETITYIHWDALGSPVAATDEAGNVVWREAYRPYGQRINNEAGASANSRWYTGHPQDTDTGLVYAGARYYDPTIGRFLGVDSVGAKGGSLQSFNRYAYGANSPYRYIDPDGRVWVDVIFVGYDIYLIGTEGATATNLVALGLDTASTFGLGFGAGQVYRAGRAAEHGYEAARGGEALAKVEKGLWKPSELEKHHTIPGEIQKKLPPEVRSHPDVRGRRGLPNRKAIPYKKHREIHEGPGGGRYNQRFDEEIKRRGGYENVSPSEVTGIRDQLVDEFGL